MNKQTLTGHILSVFTILIWGTTFISTKVLLNDFSPIEILLIRNLIGYMALWIIFPRKLSLHEKKQEWYFIGAGLCGITLYYLFENIALTFTLASNVGIIVSISPFFSSIIGCLLLKEKRPGLRFYMGFIIAMIGICFVSLNGNAEFDVSPLGNILCVLAAFIWSLYSALTKKISTFGYHNIPATRRCFFYGILFMTPCSFIMGFDVAVNKIVIPVNMLNLLFLGFGASALCFLTWNYAVKVLGVIKTSVYIYAVPVITTITSAIILHEPITKVTVAGICLILIGLSLSETGKSPKNIKRENDIYNEKDIPTC